MQRSPAENLLTQRSPAGLTCHHSVPLRSSLGNAAPPCEVVLLTQHLPARHIDDADLSCGVVLFSQHPPARHIDNADLSCGVVLFSQHPPARHIDDADLSCEVVLLTQHPPARIVVHADLSCEAPFYTRGARGSEGAQVLHHWARGSDSRGHGDSQARRQERDTMTHRSVRTEVLIFFWAGNPAPFIFFRLRLYQGTSCADGSENHCLVIIVEDI
ncbi:unnamed protein product [Penicillium salamii]|nr:unnamed protein product [Penicillium salamii]